MAKTKASKFTVGEPIGRKITKLRPMTKPEAAAQGWELGRHDVGMVIELEGGMRLFASRDSEGNGPGALFGADEVGNELGFFPER